MQIVKEFGHYDEAKGFAEGLKAGGVSYDGPRRDSDKCCYIVEYALPPIRYGFDLISEMTVDVADMLEEKYGVQGFRFTECMNVLRAELIGVLKYLGVNPDTSLGPVQWAELKASLSRRDWGRKRESEKENY